MTTNIDSVEDATSRQCRGCQKPTVSMTSSMEIVGDVKHGQCRLQHVSTMSMKSTNSSADGVDIQPQCRCPRHSAVSMMSTINIIGYPYNWQCRSCRQSIVSITWTIHSVELSITSTIDSINHVDIRWLCTRLTIHNVNDVDNQLYRVCFDKTLNCKTSYFDF